MERYVTEIMSTAHQLTAIGFEIHQEWLGTVLLADLPDSYQPMIMALESSGIQITVILKLNLQESNCQLKSTVDGDSAFHAKRQFKGTRSKLQQKTLTCWSCGKSGLIIVPKRRKKRRRRNDQIVRIRKTKEILKWLF